MVASRIAQPYRSSGFVHLSNRYSAEYQDVGAGDPILLIPGLAGGIGLMQPLVRALSRHNRVITYQLRGEDGGLFDRSYDLHRLVDDVGEVIQALRLERPTLFGVSFGGALALEFATRYPGQISSLAVQGAGSSFRPGFFGEIARQVLDRLPLPENNPFINQFFSLLIGERRHDGDQFDFIVKQCWRTDQSIMAHRLAILEEYDVTDRLSKVDLPALVFGCDQDILVRESDFVGLARALPQGELKRLKSIGHFAFVTHAQEMAQRLRMFNHALLEV